MSTTHSPASDLATAAVYRNAAVNLREEAARYMTLAVSAVPQIGRYGRQAPQAHVLMIRCYERVALDLADLAVEAEETAASYQALAEVSA